MQLNCKKPSSWQVVGIEQGNLYSKPATGNYNTHGGGVWKDQELTAPMCWVLDTLYRPFLT